MLSEDSRGWWGAGRTTKAPGGCTPPPRGQSSLQGVLPARPGRGQWRCWAPRLPVLVIMASVEENLGGQQCPGSPGTFRLTTISLHLQLKSSLLFALNPPTLLPGASMRQCWQNPLCRCPDTYLLHVHVLFLPATVVYQVSDFVLTCLALNWVHGSPYFCESKNFATTPLGNHLCLHTLLRYILLNLQI